MKKLFLFCFLLGMAPFLWADNPFTIHNVSASLVLDDESGVDYLIIINGITNDTEIEYNDKTYTSINWYKFSNPTFSISNQPELLPDSETGYILEVDGVRKTLWVLDYEDYVLNPAVVSLNLASPADSLSCELTSFELSGFDNLVIRYQDASGSEHRLDREFTMEYTTLVWGENSWNQEVVEEVVNLTSNVFDVPTSLERTSFKFSGDQYAQLMGIQIPFVEFNDEEVQPVGIASHITHETVTRDALNEVDGPKDADQVEGSGELEINFNCNSSDPDMNLSFPVWSIYKDNSTTPLITRSVHEHRHRFVESGVYKVALQLSNMQGCVVTDSVIVRVTESLLRVPNAFSPNGDGINDEFRVAYRSLETFQCRVYNNWGKLVYEWSDPAQGWDGRINGREAAPAAYFYVIRARGSDGVKYELKGDINLFR